MDGGEGWFRLDTSGTRGGGKHNNGTIADATGGTTSDFYWIRSLPEVRITPQMFGAVADGVSDDSAEVQAAADACDVLNATTVVRPELHFPPAAAYLCANTINVKENIHVDMDADIIHNGSESTAGLVIGTTAISNSSVKLKLRVSRASNSDWSDENSIGIKLINSESSDIFASVSANLQTIAPSILPGGGFTIGLQCIGSGTGFVNNTIQLGRVINHKIAMDGTNETSGGIGWFNDNVITGGRIAVNAGIHVGTERYGVRLISKDGTNKITNNNVFLKTSIECQSECIPVLIASGQKNRWIAARDEGNSSVFARVQHDDDTINRENDFNLGRGNGTLDQQGNSHSNVISYGEETPAYSAMRLVFDSGQIHENAVAYNATQTHIPNLHAARSATAVSTVADDLIVFSVSEDFTVSVPLNQLIDASHTRVNGDIVYVKTTNALPGGLSVDTEYFVVGAISDRFQLSATLGGAAITITNLGLGVQTYHSRNRYLEMGTIRAVGVRVDTSSAKNFVLERDVDTGNEGRIKVRVYDANETILKGEEDFIVDTGTNEIIQVNHTLIVGDVITLTTTVTDLPNPLAISTNYYVVSVNDTAAGRFKISAASGGAVIDITDAGTGTHTYALSHPYLTGTGFFWNSTLGGVYQQSGDSGVDYSIRVRDEVKSMDVLMVGGSNPIRIRRFKIFTTDRAVSPRTWVSYEQGEPGRALATQEPTFGTYKTPRTVWNHTPSEGEPIFWLNTMSGGTGEWADGPLVPTEESSSSSSTLQSSSSISTVDYSTSSESSTAAMSTSSVSSYSSLSTASTVSSESSSLTTSSKSSQSYSSLSSTSGI